MKKEIQLHDWFALYRIEIGEHEGWFLRAFAIWCYGVYLQEVNGKPLRIPKGTKLPIGRRWNSS